MRKHSLILNKVHWIQVLASPRAGAALLGCAIFFTYAVLPLVLGSINSGADSSYFILAALATFAVASLAMGASISLFDSWFSGRQRRVTIGMYGFNTCLWGVFVFFVFFAWWTAPKIPLLAALTGADSATVAVLREQFLKAREGWQASFVYVNAILSGALIPYSLALMFVNQTRRRWFAASLFLLYSLSFMEKAYFLKALLPLFVLAAQGRVRIGISPKMLFVVALGVVLAMTFISGAGSSEGTTDVSFFSVDYLPGGVIDHIAWRLFAIPLLTALDAVKLFENYFDGHFLLGGTSSFISGVFGIEHVEFERLVYSFQWGQNETGTGSANSVFITEAFVNFGWAGVFVFGLIVGLLMRLFARSQDKAFQALWPLFALGLYSAGLIGLLLSNGFVLLFFVILFFRIRPYSLYR